MSHLYNKEVDFIAANKDAFGRLRVSQPYTLNDYSLTNSVDTQFIANTENGGLVTVNTARASANLTTTSATNSVALYQSKMYHNYMPGKSQQIMTSFNFHGNTSNVTKRVGYFDANNGIYLEQTGDSTLNWVIRSNVSGSVQERRISRNNWNMDTCDGAGKSGFNLAQANTQLSFIDFQWLGVGTVRCGFAHDGKYIIAHEFYNSNLLESVYMRTGSLPVRYEIRNGGTTTGGVLEQICSTVVSEGGYIEAGRDWAVQSNAKSLTAGTELPILALKLKSTFDSMPNRAIIRMKGVEVFTTAENILYKVLRLPDQGFISIGTNNWISASTSSAAEYISEAYAYTDGQQFINGFASATSQNDQKSAAGPANVQEGPTARKNFITQNIESSNSEIYVLVAKNIGTTTTNVYAAFSWREVY